MARIVRFKPKTYLRTRESILRDQANYEEWVCAVRCARILTVVVSLATTRESFLGGT